MTRIVTTMMMTDAEVQYMQILLIRSRYFAPKTFTRNAMSITAQKQSTVCHWLAIKSSFQREIELNINCAPEKLMLRVTVQFPTKVSHPVIQETIGAYFLVLNIADQ